MKILTIINSLDNSGQYFMPLFEGIISRGHNIFVISNISKMMRDKLSRRNIDYLNLNPPKYKTLRALSSIENWLLFPFYLLKITNLIKREKYDLIHVHHVFMPLFYGCILSKLFKIPIVLTLHGGRPSNVINFSSLRQVHSIIVTSREQKGGLAGLQTKINVIPLPIDIHRFSPESPESIYGEKKESQKKIVLISRLDPDKILVVKSLIKSAPKIAASVENVQIVIAGNGSITYEILQMTKRINHEIGKNMIVLSGFVEDTPNLIRQADLVIGVGVVVLEALSCGKPVIVAGALIGSRGGSFGGIITKQNIDELRSFNFSGRNSIARTDATKIYTSVIRLLNDEPYMKKLGKLGRTYIENEFQPCKIAKEVELVYAQAQLKAQIENKYPSIISPFISLLKIISYLVIFKIGSIIHHILLL